MLLIIKDNNLHITFRSYFIFDIIFMGFNVIKRPIKKQKYRIVLILKDYFVFIKVNFELKKAGHIKTFEKNKE